MSRRRVCLLISISLFIGLTSMLLRQLFSTASTSTSPKLKFTMSSTHSKRVIVIGSGLAGLTASSTLVARNIPVLLLERSAKPGGNSVKASSGINGAPTKYQPGPPFSDTTFYSDTITSAGKVFTDNFHSGRATLVKTLTNKSAEAIEWLSGEKGVDLSVVAQLGGHSFPRTHRGAGKTPPGASLVFTLLGSLKTNPLFELSVNSTVTKLLKDDQGIQGVEYQLRTPEGVEESREAKGPVVVTTGGFGGDAHGLLAQYRPDLAGIPSTNDARPGSQPLLQSIGAILIDMAEVQVHPTAFIDPASPASPVKFLAAELLRGEGGLLLNPAGKRFVNEMETRKVVTGGIMSLPLLETENGNGIRQYDVKLVLDEGVYKNASSHIDFYIFKSLVKKAPISSLPPSALDTIKAYSQAAAGETEDSFKRQYFGHWELKPEDATPDTEVYVGTVTPAVHFTMGGVVINEKGEVLDADRKTIKGVWAAGEVTGGIHGENRLGGSSLLECVVFGRVVGEQAVKFVGGE